MCSEVSGPFQPISDRKEANYHGGEVTVQHSTIGRALHVPSWHLNWVDGTQTTWYRHDVFFKLCWEEVIVFWKALKQQLNSLKTNRVSRKPSRKFSRVHETKVTDLEWSGSNQKGSYMGYTLYISHAVVAKGL